MAADETMLDRIAKQLRAADKSLFTDQSLCGAVRAYSEDRHTMFNTCIARTGPTRLLEQEGPLLWPKMGTDGSAVAPASDSDTARSLRSWSLRVKQIVGFAFDADAALQQQAIAAGLHWVTPIGTTTYGCWIGLRRLPNTPLADCPVVLCHGENASTIASRLVDSLAVLLWQLGPRDDASATEVLRNHWPTVKDELLACAEPLGGTQAIRAMHDHLHSTRHPDLDSDPGSASYLMAVACIFRRLDPGQASFRMQVPSLRVGGNAVYADVPGAWQEALAANEFAAHRTDPACAWRVAAALPSLDTGGRLQPGHFVSTKSNWSTLMPIWAASAALKAPRSGIVAQAVATLVAATAAGKKYHGSAHLEAALSAAAAGDNSLAWTLFGAAGFWSAHANGRADPAIYAAARQVGSALDIHLP